MQIRNSTVDFLVFTKDAHEDGIEVRVQDNNVWLTQKAIGQLFDVDRSVITKHLKTSLKAVNWTKNQLVQILHKLRTTEKPINTNIILCLPLSLPGIVSTPAGQRSFVSGQQEYWTPLQSKVMCWIRAG